MSAGSSFQGYTIIETMIFLAISGLMFVMAGNFISGKQSKAEFRQGLNAMNTHIRDVVNDVGNGYFPPADGFGCQADDSGGTPFSSTAKEQGANQGCVFLGKVIQFGPQETVASSFDEGYNIYTVAGRQFKGSSLKNELPQSYAEAKPKIFFELTEKKTNDWGLKIIKALNESTPINGIAFFGTLASKATPSGQSGAQNVVVIPIPGSQPGLNETDATFSAEVVNTLSNPSLNTEYDPEIVLCYESGTGQFGTIKMGDRDPVTGQKKQQRHATAVQIYNSKPSICS